MGRQSIAKNWVKWYRRHVADPFKNFRRQIRRGVSRPGLALGYQGFRRTVARCDWDGAHRRLFPVAEAALKAGDAKLLTEMGFSAERLDEHEKSTAWLAAAARLAGEPKPSEWTGGDLNDATLLVRFMESEKQGLANGLNMAGYVKEAAARAAHCGLVVEKRLVPLFRRTLPEVETVAYPETVAPKDGTRLVTANLLTLRSVLGTSPEGIGGRFQPLKAEPGTSAAIRERYLNGRKLPLIGISWWSSHFGKDLPALEDWAAFVRSTEAVFVSIQYGDIDADLEVLRNAAPDRLVVDDSVDQMTDMDGFAAQLGALDAAVTISNTGAHLAGAMEIPTCLIRDDWFRRQWPVRSDRTPWYPKTRVFGKNARAWTETFGEVRGRLEKWLDGET